VINRAFEKIFEVQAHSAPLERLRVSPDNQYLYSTGQDYMLAIFNVTDKDPNKKDKEAISVQNSDEILFAQKQRIALQNKIETLKQNIAVRNANREQ